MLQHFGSKGLKLRKSIVKLAKLGKSVKLARTPDVCPDALILLSGLNALAVLKGLDVPNVSTCQNPGWKDLKPLKSMVKLARRELQVRQVRHELRPTMMITDLSVFLTRFLLLRQSGDIEANPGPSNDQLQDQLQDGAGGRGRGQVHGGQVQGGPQGGANVNRSQKKERSTLQVTTANVRGLCDNKKLRHLINSCYKITKESENNLFLFQEVFAQKLGLLNYLWRGDFHLTPGTGNSQGCLSLVTAPYKIAHAEDLGHRAHVLVLTKDNPNKVEMIVANAYAPNGFDADKLTFFEEITERIALLSTTYNCENILLAGDLNMVFKPEEVKNRLISASEQRIALSTKALFDDLSLVDCWDEAPSRMFTWTSNRTGTQSFSTLDRILYRNDRLRLSSNKANWSLCVSDHAAVTATFLNINICSSKSPLIARLDARLLQDLEGRTVLEDEFRELINQAAVAWNPHVRLEYYKMSLRTAANLAAGKVKAKFRDSEASLNKDINEMINELADEAVQHDRKILIMHKLDDLRRLKRALVDKIGSRLEQRTARKWYNEGELSNKYFFSLLNRRSNDNIDVVIDENGTEKLEPAEIENEIRSFYKNLYELPNDQIVTNDSFFRHIEEVPQERAATIVMPLTLEELTGTLQTCSDSAPGPDGIPYSFLKHFWNDFGPVLLDAWQYSLIKSELPPSHKVSYLRLIPKAGKDTRIISNLRPITLSNTDHKLITKTYAKKLTKLVSDRIGEEQTAYIPGRLINDNIRAMLATVDLADVDEAVDGVLVSLDAKKAFDSVDHGYIRRCLKAFGLSSFTAIFDVLYKGLQSKIIINGQAVEGFDILRGVKQGDALSCVLFIMCIEPLIRNIKANPLIENITSVTLPLNIPKSYGFADDVSIATKNKATNVQAIFDEYEVFTNNSGLILNADKTEILCFNKARNLNHQYQVRYRGNQYNLTAAERIKINGIIILQDPMRRETVNVRYALDAMEKLLRAWSTRRLTLLGKVLIIKTFAIAKVIYLMQTFTLMEPSFKAIDKVIFKYLWNKNFNGNKAPERLKREIMLTPVSMGGFGLIEVRKLADSLDLRSYGRLLCSNHPLLAQVKHLINANDPFNVTSPMFDNKLKRSLHLLNEQRVSMLKWPVDKLLNNHNFVKVVLNARVSQLITQAGRQSLLYYRVHTRHNHPKVVDITQAEGRDLKRFIKYPDLRPLIEGCLGQRHVAAVNVTANLDAQNCYPVKSMTLLNVSSLSSKGFRVNKESLEEQVICIYKIGLILDPGEVLSWTRRVKKLTSTRHRNILLRVVHGDIFCNERLHRFGLINEPVCLNCPEQSESILHRIIECPVANQAWQELEKFKRTVGLLPLTDLSLENLVGAKDHINKYELAFQAELLHKLTSINKVTCPIRLVKAVVKLVGHAERLNPDLKMKVDSYLSQ